MEPVEPSARDDEQFAAVYREYIGLVVKTCHAFAVEQADRDDLCQEILVALWRALPRFNAEAKLSTYVYRVALSCAINWRRTQHRYRRKVDLYIHTDHEHSDVPAGNQERLEWLYARIRELAEIDRTLILLYLERLNYAQIADVTGISESNVGVRLHRIKQHLIAQSENIKHDL